MGFVTKRDLSPQFAHHTFIKKSPTTKGCCRIPANIYSSLQPFWLKLSASRHPSRDTRTPPDQPPLAEFHAQEEKASQRVCQRRQAGAWPGRNERQRNGVTLGLRWETLSLCTSCCRTRLLFMRNTNPPSLPRSQKGHIK